MILNAEHQAGQEAPALAPRGVSVAVVIPCYCVEAHISDVIRQLPGWVTHVIAVDDASTDSTGAVLASLRAEYADLIVITHDRNRGVGAATMTGMQVALELGADLIVKMDGDGQMNPSDLPRLLVPLLDGSADVSKGNRLHTRGHAARMPRLRLFANIVLTLMTKLSSGYWRVADAQNGYIAMTQCFAREIAFDKLEPRHAFENSLLVQANIAGAVVVEIPMVAIYGDEISSLHPVTSGLVFPLKIAKMFVSRIVRKYVIDELSPVAAGMIGGSMLAVLGCWMLLARGIGAETGPMAVASLISSLTLWIYAVRRDGLGAPRPREPEARISADLIPLLCRAPTGDVDDVRTHSVLGRPEARNTV